MKSYHAWDKKYHWTDYLSRTKLAKTFYKRHAPLSGGQRGIFGDLLRDPESWDEPGVAAASGDTEKGRGKKPAAHLTTMNKAATEIMDEWDSDIMEWTPRS